MEHDPAPAIPAYGSPGSTGISSRYHSMSHAASYRSMHDVLVIALVLRNDPVGAEALARVPAARFRHAVVELVIREQFDGACRLTRDIFYVFEETILAVGDQLRH